MMNIHVATIYYYFIYLLLFLQVSPTDATCNRTDAQSSTSCTSPVMECAQLGYISYPFSGSASCAASPSYAFSNCATSSPHAYWDSFSDAQSGALHPPLVVNLSQAPLGDSFPNAYVDLTWNTSFLSMNACAPPYFPSKSLSQYSIPASINLTGFASSSFYFSYKTSYLLFNCTNKAFISQLKSQLNFQYYLTEEGEACSSYKRLCGAQLPETSCIQLIPYQELMLKLVLDNLSCSHFTFGLLDTRSDQVIWNTGVVRLSWENALNRECIRCVIVGGTCGFDSPLTTSKLSYCECKNRKIRNFETMILSNPNLDCFLLPEWLEVLHLLIWVVVLSCLLLVFGAVYYRCKIRKGIFYVFSVKLAPVAITILKKTVKQLQALSYRPSYSFKDMDLEGLTERPVEYSYSSIASATKSFSSVLGEGGFGVVYKGMLPLQPSTPRDSGRCQIAVKVLEMRSRHSKKQFLNEVITIGRIHHLNVVRLLGFCMQEGQEMLVYEYVENGSLDRWLFDYSGKDEKQVLDWGQRYAIAVGIAKGLSYLHEECRHRTVHCDIKPHNILLDAEMRPKIADFGLARLMGREESQVVTLAKGTPGYMAPEFWTGGESQLSTKFDVYSYGMVLLELMSGSRNFSASGRCFPAVAFEAALQEDFATVLDTRLGIDTSSMLSTSDIEDEAQSLQRDQIRTALFTALWCIQDQPARRPCMSEVVQYLDGVATVPEDPPQPTISISNTSLPPHTLSNTRSTRQHDFTPISVGR